MLNLATHRKPVSIIHPLVQRAYLKKEIRTGRPEEDVLVLEVAGSATASVDGACGDFDPYLVALLNDLQELRDQAEKQGSPCKRIDIICRHLNKGTNCAAL